MALSITRPSYKREIYERMREDIRAQRIEVGQCLPPLKQIAAQLGTSVAPVQEAYTALQQGGYVECRRGLGTVVVESRPEAQFSDSVAVCLESGAHVFGELALQMAGGLHAEGVAPIAVDLSERDGASEVMRRLARAGVHLFVVHVHQSRHVDCFRERPFAEATCIGAVHWNGPRTPRMAAVLSDPVAGAKSVVKQLAAGGHRRVLVLETQKGQLEAREPLADDTSLYYNGVRHGVEFARQWRAMGNSYSAVASRPAGEEHCAFDPPEFLQYFDQDEPPTAIFGVRDIEVVRAQQLLRAHRPHLLEQLDFVGYYNTPWSEAANPGMATVDIDIPCICNELERVIRCLRDGEPAPTEPILVTPRLVDRSRVET